MKVTTTFKLTGAAAALAELREFVQSIKSIRRS